MAKFISISGPSTSGKTALVNTLITHSELSKAVSTPDIQDYVWNTHFVDKGFSEFSDITTDPEYLSIYILKMVSYYNDLIETYKPLDQLFILDGCWLDLAIYSILNMWYSRGIKSVQEDILSKLSVFDENVSRIYLTKVDDIKYPVNKYKIRGKINSFKANRPLEIQYYELAKHFTNTVPLPSSDPSESSLFILNDLKNLGYL